MRLRNTWVGLLGMALATTLACGGGSSETKPADAAAPAAGAAASGGGSKVDPATAGDIRFASTIREYILEGLRKSLPHDVALQNAPGADGTFFKVPKVIKTPKS